ncbi:MAG: carbamoyltransferase HypF, partial [Acetobacteraceae bacterium]|nr:carbamoyltransferase HypF [Acetobacteraceae bacterium]
IERVRQAETADDGAFRIAESESSEVQTSVIPDAATCLACRDEIFDRLSRRYLYPFANCTHCGPRLSIIEAIPYDRAATTMRAFPMCQACAAEYADPLDRRFHAQPIACPECGPHVWLEPPIAGDALEAARHLLLAGQIVAVKALGGFHLACDASHPAAVARLRDAKRRDAKPFALMARDMAVIRHYAVVTGEAEAALQSPAAPIVVLDALKLGGLAGVAPGLNSLGFMLPSTPLHHLLLRNIDRPLVMTSGNLSDEPQCISNADALERLAGIADYFLFHDRDIARRVDDSVVRVMAGAGRVLRRARGYAPAPILLPDGFRVAAPVLAMGGELKNTFCFLREGNAILSHHMGDLENAPTFANYCRSIEQYRALFAHAPQAIVVDYHPEYLSRKFGLELAERHGLAVIEVQHHHAHLAACMAENAIRLDERPVLGIVLDGLGWGEDGAIWGAEFLLGDYRGFRRVACLKPVAMPGGAQAIREPWRNLVAQILACQDWPLVAAMYGATDVFEYFHTKPMALIAQTIARGANAPLASSCGRLFDAVAAAIGLCRDRALYEGQAAMMLEAAASSVTSETGAYPFAIAPHPSGLLHLDPAPLWTCLLRDISNGTPSPVMAARFHAGLAQGVARTVEALGVKAPVALSGGVFQNRLLLEQVVEALAGSGLRVLTQRLVPANDGGLALGQAAIAAARMLGN